MKIWIDVESYSELDINEVGPFVYWLHPSTELLCLSWRAENDEDGFWVSEITPDGETEFVPLARLFNTVSLQRLFKLVENRSNVIEAHNAMFERCAWLFHGVRKFGWPEIEFDQWRCSAAKAAACSLPRALGDAGRAMALRVRKNEEAGKRLIDKLTQPDRKGNKPRAPKEDWEEFYEYCRQDTAAERCLSEALPELSTRELAVWRMDQRMNWRGFRIDIPGIENAITIAATWTETLNAELSEITGGEVTKATQRKRLLAWLQRAGVNVWDTKATTLDALYPAMEPGPAKRAIEILRSIGRSSTAKYVTAKVSSEGERLRDTMMYHGAGTGRWTARRFQCQNLPRVDAYSTNEAIDRAWSVLREGDVELIRLLYGDPMEFLSGILRGAIIADDDALIHAGDYSAIETCGLFWIADEKPGLALLASGGDIYLDMASDIYGRIVTKADDAARQLGKRAILGLGYGMGYIKFLLTCHTYDLHFTPADVRAIVPADKIRSITEWIKGKDWQRCANMGMQPSDLAELVLTKYVTDRYREKYEKTVKQLWEDCENAAKNAVRNPGKMFVAGRTGFVTEEYGDYDKLVPRYEGDFGGELKPAKHLFLTAHLPSRRKLYYPDIELDEKYGLSYMGQDSVTHQWIREKTYGGKIVENIVQALSRDIMAEAKLRFDRLDSVFEILLSVHDEVVCQSDCDRLKEFNDILSQLPEWAYGFPLTAKSWTGPRYRK